MTAAIAPVLAGLPQGRVVNVWRNVTGVPVDRGVDCAYAFSSDVGEITCSYPRSPGFGCRTPTFDVLFPDAGPIVCEFSYWVRRQTHGAIVVAAVLVYVFLAWPRVGGPGDRGARR